MAMHKTRNTGTGNGMRGTRGMGGMLYFGECRQIFRGMSPNIPENVLKHPGECGQTFRRMSPNIRRMSPNIPGNVLKHSGECHQTFRRMSSNILENVVKHSGKYPQTFRAISPNIPGNVPKRSGECLQITIVNSECFTVHYVLISSIKVSIYIVSQFPRTYSLRIQKKHSSLSFPVLLLWSRSSISHSCSQ